MRTNSRTNFLLKIALCVTLALAIFGAALSFVGENKLVAKAETADDVTDTVSIVNSSYGENQSQFIIKLTPASTLTSNAWWNINGSTLITANNGVDIMNYIYINGQNLRTLSDDNRTNNTYPVDTASGWLANSDQCRPAFVESTGDGIYVTVLHAFSTTNYTITLKADFSILNTSGTMSTVSKDVNFTYNAGTVSKTTDVTDTVSIVNSSYGENQSQFIIKLNPASTLTSNAWWNINGSTLITANNGVDIMNYIYINGKNIRTLSDDNKTNNTYPVDTASGWLANSDQCRPAFVESTGDGIYVTVLHAFSTTNYTITLKAGFSILNTSGTMSTVSEDVSFIYNAGKVTKIEEYTLSFSSEAGTVAPITVTGGQAIGELPAVPEKDGCAGVWTIDGEEITADTVYNYGENKTAVAVYTKTLERVDVTKTVEIDASSGDVQSQFKIALTPNSALTSNAWWNINGSTLIAANNGVDIMNYIYINGENIRTLSDNNRTNNTYPVGSATGWLTNSNQCRPAFVETTANGIFVTVLHAFSTTNYTITLKAGFELLNADDKIYTISEDVSFICNAGKVTKIEEYTLSFEGLDDTVTVTGGQAIGELPAVPEKDGCAGVWTIDGEEITTDTVYNYGENKTAVAVYTKDVTETVEIDASSGDVQSQFKIALPPNSALTSNAWWNINGSTLIAANNGVDIMNYIYINGENIRTLSDNNRTNNTYPVGSATGWLANSDQCRPAFVETTSDGIFVTVLHAFSTKNYTITIKAGFELLGEDGVIYTVSEDVSFICNDGVITKIEEYTLSFEGLDDTVTVTGGQAIGTLPEVPEADGKIALGWAIDGVAITEETVWTYTENKTATVIYAQNYTLSFEGLEDTVTVVNGQPIGTLPAVPAKEGCEGVWTIDGVEINADTVYTYGADMTAVAAYSKNINELIGLGDYSTDYGNGDFCFVAKINTYSTVTGVWNINKDTLTAANNNVDIMQYIYVKDNVSARAHSDANASSNQYVGNGGWLANGYECCPVFIETTDSGLWIRIDTDFAGDFFEITFKAGFRLIDTEGTVVYLSKDVTYKYINDGETVTFAKGTITEADLDKLEGQQITLMNGETTYYSKSKRQLTLPEPDAVIVEEGLSQVFVGWTTDTTNLSNLYPAGYKYTPTVETTLYAVWIGFEMQDGAAVRLTQGSSGIRFLVDVDANGYNVGVNKGLILSAGTFVVPTDYLESGIAFVHSSFAEGYYTDKVTETWRVNGEEDATWTYSAAFVNISVAQYSRRLSARGYLKIQYTDGAGYIYTPYTEEKNARSIYEVATMGYDKLSGYQIVQDYVNKVADVTWDGDTFEHTDGAKGNYTVESISADGATFTVKADGEFSSVLINGRRLVEGYSTNVAIGNFIYKFSGFEIVDGGFKFTLGAADEFAQKASDETLYFYSSDADLDFFLNDFFKRHSGYTEDGVNLKVNSVTAGVNSQEFFSHEWMSMAYYWYNSDDGYAEDRIAGLREFLSSVPVDDYGYVWSSNDRVRDNAATPSSAEQRMGWPYPSNDDIKGVSWDFNGSTNSWTSNIGATSNNDLFTANVSGQTADILFSSPNGFHGTGNIFTRKRIYTYSAPLLEFDIRIDDVTNVNDILVGYTTSVQSTMQWVSVKEYAFLSYDIGNATGKYEHLIFMPMYAFWGESTSEYLKQIQIKIDIKDGASMSGNVGLNYVRPTIDTRYSNNNSILISSLRQDYDFTGDLEYLKNNITRARKAMNFLMQMYDATRKLNNQAYLVGHDGDQSDIESSLGNGYWDILFMPEYDFQSNTYFYKALADMAYLEDVLVANNVTVDKSLATVKTATRSKTTSTSAYDYTADSLASTANDVLGAMRETTANGGFWNQSTGRFAAGFNSKGTLYDYGYVAWNLEAIYYGVATEAQADSIMNWLTNESDLYDYTFAPTSITETGNKLVLNGQYYNNSSIKNSWVNCQYGGAILYTSFFDLMARIDYVGVEDAYARLQAIQEWYMTVYNYYSSIEDADPNEFYRYYYEAQEIQMQGQGTNGAIGIDAEFLESYLPLSAVAYGFFGIDSIDGKTLQIAPELPTELTYWGMENLAFNFVEYDLKAFKNGVQITSVRGDTAGLKLQIVLDWTEGNKLFVNGIESNDYTVENGKVYVTVNFGATVVEVR